MGTWGKRNWPTTRRTLTALSAKYNAKLAVRAWMACAGWRVCAAHLAIMRAGRSSVKSAPFVCHDNVHIHRTYRHYTRTSTITSRWAELLSDFGLFTSSLFLAC